MEASASASSIIQSKLPPYYPWSSSSSSPSSRTVFSCPAPPVSSPFKKPHQISLKGTILRHGQFSKLSQLNCAKEGGRKELMESNEGGEEGLNLELVEEVIEMGKLNEKCKEVGGVVELLECLEREAIMGEDVGRDPTDYNRRAQIFAKSSRVFQAIRDSTSTSTTSG